MATGVEPFELNHPYKFYGVDDGRFKLDAKVFYAQEDESDGYRSYLESVELVAKKDTKDLIFFKRALDIVQVTHGGGNFEGFRLVSVVDGHEWLRFGTSYNDVYYPVYVFVYNPRPAEVKDAPALDANSRVDMMNRRKELSCSFCPPNKKENRKHVSKHGKKKAKGGRNNGR